MLRPVEDHQRLIAALLTTTATERVSLDAAAGRALAFDLVAPISLPSFDSSSMDGYAVLAGDVAKATLTEPVKLPVTDDIPAGRVRVKELVPGTCQRIMTGAPLPPGADAVVPVEATDGGTVTVQISEPRERGQHVRVEGCDVRPGDVVLRKGTRLRGPQLGLIAALGIDAVEVHQPVRVLLVSTGSELVEPGRSRFFGEVYDANSNLLAASLSEAGAVVEVAHFVADDVETFLAVLRDRAGSADLILTSGGVSAGAYEVVKDGLAEHPVEFTKIAMQPGMPQGAGHFDGTPIICLPGNPVSAYVSFEVLVRPALLTAMGHTVTLRPTLRAATLEAIRSPAAKRQLRRGVIDFSDGTVRLKGGFESHFLGSLADANCLIDLPLGVTFVETGQMVNVWLLASF